MRVAILMGVLNGARWLPAQLASIRSQSHSDWHLVARDDGSADESREILDRFVREVGADRATLTDGPRRGVTANFLGALADVPEGHGAAFSDQDDVWDPEKLAVAVADLDRAGHQPAAWACRLMRVDAALRPIGPTKSPRRGPGFANALVENILSGNATVLNPAAVSRLRPLAAAAISAGVPVHDWWVYQVISGIGGKVIWRDEPLVLYRQHGGNVIGAQGGAAAALLRIRRLADGTFAGWLDANRMALDAVPLSDEAAETLRAFDVARSGPAWRLPGAFSAAGIHRQGARDDMVLRMSARLGCLTTRSATRVSAHAG